MMEKWLQPSLCALSLLAMHSLHAGGLTEVGLIGFEQTHPNCQRGINRRFPTPQCAREFIQWIEGNENIAPRAFDFYQDNPHFEVIQGNTNTFSSDEVIFLNGEIDVNNVEIQALGNLDYVMNGGAEVFQMRPEVVTRNLRLRGSRARGGSYMHSDHLQVAEEVEVGGNIAFNTENLGSTAADPHADFSAAKLSIKSGGTYRLINVAKVEGPVTGASATIGTSINMEPGAHFEALNFAPVFNPFFGAFVSVPDFFANTDVVLQNTGIVYQGTAVGLVADEIEIEAPPQSLPLHIPKRAWAENAADIIGADSKGIAIEADQFTLKSGTVLLRNRALIEGADAIGVSANVGNYTQIGGVLILEDQNPSNQGKGVVLHSSNNIEVVDGQLILVNGRMLADREILINDRATLTGRGAAVARERIRFAGNASIGNSPGTLFMITPEVIQEETSTFKFTVQDACHFSQLNATGTVTLSGTAEIIADDWFCVGSNESLPIVLAAGGVSGQFNCVESCLPSGVFPILSYQPNAVFLSFLFKCPCLCEYIGNFTQTLFSSITDTNNFMIKRELQRVQERIVSKDANKKMGNFFIGPLGSVGRSDQHGSQVGFDFWSAGAVAGADYAFSQGGVGGLVLYENIQSDDEADCFGHFRTQRAHGSLYGAYIPAQAPQFSLDLMVGGGYDWYNIHRSIERGSARGKPNGYEVDGMLSLEYTFARNAWHVIPMVNLQYIYLHVDGYRESGFGFTNLSFESQKAKSLSTIVGASADNTWKWQYPLTAQVNLGWQREYLNHDRTLRYAGCKTLELDGASRNNLLAGADLWLQIKDGWGIEGSYELIWNNHFYRNGFYLGLNSTF